MHQLTRNGSHILRVTLEDWDGSTAYAEYSDFRVDDEQTEYKLRFDRFIGGNAGDALDHPSKNLKNQPFSTFDNDNDANNNPRSCAVTWHSGWWHQNCYRGNLNGEYRTYEDRDSNTGVQWYTWKNSWNSFKHASMKIRQGNP